jgi:hypothetical protein
MTAVATTMNTKTTAAAAAAAVRRRWQQQQRDGGGSATAAAAQWQRRRQRGNGSGAAAAQRRQQWQRGSGGGQQQYRGSSINDDLFGRSGPCRRCCHGKLLPHPRRSKVSSSRVDGEMGVLTLAAIRCTLAAIGWQREESSNAGLQPLNQPTGEGTLKEAPHSEIGDVLLGEHRRSHGICDTCFRHQKEDVDKLILLCQVNCNLPGSHGEYNPTLDKEECEK